ncbi:uncharacterized protein FIESC28_05370 [Fusarium coffeatum]|uniref:Uncharacterized protein n=1 Tax=Fusarium coffeatum TaxID=231269 RepID=A0A366RSM4_9HYPO|nr:uncharacterized protein FIESC28_05370 [Fusarium coffeatum]RBR20091.1 hypothetical protein FIESC28_05370 [Fusarium coffeatum]
MSSQNSFQSYKKQQIYGQDVGSRAHPSPEAERDYKEYCQWRNQSNTSVRFYDSTLETVAGSRTADIQKLQQHQHQQLVYPAAQAATDTNFHASTRNAFLDNHPFAYRDMVERSEHEGLADASVHEAKYYRAAYDTHYEKSAPFKSRPNGQPPYGSYGSTSSPTPRPGPSQGSRPPAPRDAYGSYNSTGRR